MILYFIILYYIILYYIILYYYILYYIILYYSILLYIKLYYVILYCIICIIILYYIKLYHIISYHIILCNVILYYIISYYINYILYIICYILYEYKYVDTDFGLSHKVSDQHLPIWGFFGSPAENLAEISPSIWSLDERENLLESPIFNGKMDGFRLRFSLNPMRRVMYFFDQLVFKDKLCSRILNWHLWGRFQSDNWRIGFPFRIPCT